MPVENSNEITQSERGFSQGDAITDEGGGRVRAYESSAALEAHIWLNALGSPVYESVSEPNEATLHLNLEEATALKDQLEYLIDNHYHKTLYADLYESE